MSGVDLISGYTFHGRKGAVENGFRYSIDYVLLDADALTDGPGLFSRNAGNVTSVQDRDHGGAPGQGQGARWAHAVLDPYALGYDRLMLLTQPRVLGYVFNPVSFWLAFRGDDLVGAIAEVTNTFGDRHSYVCVRPCAAAIRPDNRIKAQKILHVSPFQPVEGSYEFRFDIGPDRIGIWIDYGREKGGVVATLCGARAPLTNAGIVRSLWRRPFGARRVMALIHWQALKLWWKGARYRTRPSAPAQETSGWHKPAKGAS